MSKYLTTIVRAKTHRSKRGDDISDSGTGLQSFENTTSFGTTDGSYTSTVAVGEENPITVPFKLHPTGVSMLLYTVNTSRDVCYL